MIFINFKVLPFYLRIIKQSYVSFNDYSFLCKHKWLRFLLCLKRIHQEQPHHTHKVLTTHRCNEMVYSINIL